MSDYLNINESNQPDLVNADWIVNLLGRVKALEVYPHEEALAETLVQQAIENARLTSTSLGLSLAAAFDLIVAAEYYTKVANKGWLYCPASDYPLLVYPYTNTCPRCVLKGNFCFHQANKLPSGTIGKTTSRLLCVFLKCLFKINCRDLKIYSGSEPVDLTHPPLKRRRISCYLLFVICYLYSLTNNKQQTTKRRTAIPPLPRRKGLPAAFCDNS